MAKDQKLTQDVLEEDQVYVVPRIGYNEKWYKDDVNVQKEMTIRYSLCRLTFRKFM